MSDSYFSYSKILQLKSIRADFAVKVLLIERLEKIGVNPFKTYLNTVVDIIDYQVNSSRSLFEETLAWVEKEAMPDYVQGNSNVFSRQFSFDSKDRVEGLGVIGFETIVIDIVKALTAPPSVNLANGSIKSLNVEDVHAALKYKVPGINIDEVYVTSYVMDRGQRKVFSSRSLAEDIHVSLQDNEIPYYHGDDLGIYSVAYSSHEHDIHPQLTASDVSRLVIEIVPDFLI